MEMREWIKSYHMFLPGRWGKWIVYILLPVFFFGIGYIFGKGILNGYIAIIILSSLIISLEIYIDYFVFGGIASKDTNKLEYLKTSVKGMKVLKKSLVGDAVRRFLSIGVIVYGLKYVYGYGYSNGQAMTLVLCYFALSELALFITRHFSFLALVSAGVVIISVAAPWITAWLLAKNTNTFIVGIILSVLALGIAVVSRSIIMKKARGSYYDERN